MALKKLLVVSLLIFVSLERFCHYQTGGFRFYKLISPRQDADQHETDLEIVSQVTEKPLKYLGTGNQFYVFASADGKYVIKFIKHSWKDHVFKNRERRFQDIVKSCNLGFHQLAKETGIVTCSFTRKKLPEATLIDKLGIAHKIDLRKTEFIIQKKVSPFAGPLNQEKIRSLIHLVTHQCQKNIVNLDPMIDRNFGFCDNEAVLIDFGSLKYDATRRVDREIFLELLGLREWLQNNQPELVSHFDQEITQVLF
jgi:hypothetical protein